MPNSAFNFETFMVEQIGSINKKLDNLGSVYLPREEAVLMHTQTQNTLAILSKTVETHATLIAALKTTDDVQQGAIEAKKSMSATLVAVIAAAGAFLGAIASLVVSAIAHIHIK